MIKNLKFVPVGMSLLLFSFCSNSKDKINFRSMFISSSITAQELIDEGANESKPEKFPDSNILIYSFSKKDSSLQVHFQNQICVMSILHYKIRNSGHDKSIDSLMRDIDVLPQDLQSFTKRHASFRFFSSKDLLVYVIINDSSVVIRKMNR